MTITSDRVREIFKGLENGDGAAFFEHVADNVDWTVMGTHPLAGHYPSKRRAPSCASPTKSSRGTPQWLNWCRTQRRETVCASTTITAGLLASIGAPLSKCAPISTRRWSPSCSVRTRLPRPKIKEAVLADLGWLGFVELEKMSTGFLTIGTDPMNLNFAAMPEAACERGVKIEDPGKD